MNILEQAMDKCSWVFGCEYTPTWVVRTAVHNDPRPMCDEHKRRNSESLSGQGYGSFDIPIEEENGLHPRYDPNSMFNARKKAKEDNTDRWVVRCNNFDAAAKYAGEQDWSLRSWTWLPAYTVHNTIQVFERKQ